MNPLEALPKDDNLNEGDVLVTNHPYAGDSHLPDITVITPVFNNGKLVLLEILIVIIIGKIVMHVSVV